MEALQTLVPIVLAASLAGLILAVGLNADRGDLLYVVKRPTLFLKAILSVIVIPPIAAAIIIGFAPIAPAAKAGIMLMAISPVPPLLPGKELAIGARKEYAYGLYAALVLTTLISVPIVFNIAAALYGSDDRVSFGAVFATIAGGVLLPLAIGVAVKRIAPRLAEATWQLIAKAAMALVLLAFIAIVIRAWPAMVAMIGDGTLLAMAAVSAIAIAAGHFLGGPDRVDRATLATASVVRHPGISISLASAAFADPRVSAAIVLFMLVGMIVAAPYSAWIKKGTPPGAPAHA